MIQKEQITTLLDCIKSGLNISDSCTMARISRITYYAWLKEKPEFEEEVERARLTLKKEIVSIVLEAAKTDWRAGMTFLERIYRNEYSLPTQLENEMNERMDRIESLLSEYTKKPC